MKNILRDNEMRDAKALGTIQGAVSDAISPRISHEETAMRGPAKRIQR